MQINDLIINAHLTWFRKKLELSYFKKYHGHLSL